MPSFNGRVRVYGEPDINIEALAACLVDLMDTIYPDTHDHDGAGTEEERPHDESDTRHAADDA